MKKLKNLTISTKIGLICIFFPYMIAIFAPSSRWAFIAVFALFSLIYLGYFYMRLNAYRATESYGGWLLIDTASLLSFGVALLLVEYYLGENVVPILPYAMCGILILPWCKASIRLEGSAANNS